MQLANLIKNAVVGGGTLITLAATVGVNPAEAASIVNLGDSFQDSATGLLWKDVDLYFGMTYNEVETSISGSGSRMATLSEVQQLFSSYTQADFSSYASAMCTTVGCEPTPRNRNIIWGSYDDGDLSDNGAGYAWVYGWDSTLSNADNNVDVDATKFNDMGAWVIAGSTPTTDVPEPTSFLGMLTALGFVAAFKRRQVKV
jgi:hypothetical protein